MQKLEALFDGTLGDLRVLAVGERATTLDGVRPDLDVKCIAPAALDDSLDVDGVDCLAADYDALSSSGVTVVRELARAGEPPVVLLATDPTAAQEADGDVVYQHASTPPETLATVIEQMATRTRLERRARQRAELLTHTTDVITVLDENGVVRYASPSIAQTLGYDHEAFVGEHVFEYIHADDRDEVVSVFESAPSTPDETSRVEHRFRTADGEWQWMESAGQNRWRDSLGGYIVTSRDVTERKRVEAEQKRVLDRMTDAFFSLNEDWEFTYLNDQMEDLIAARFSEGTELLGTTFWEAVPEASGTKTERQFRAAVTTGESKTFETYYQPLDVWFDISVYPDVDGLSVYFRDVTERKETEAELRRGESALRQLYEVSSDPDIDFDEKLPRVLELGRDFLGLPYGFLTRIEDGTQEILAARGDHPGLAPGQRCPLSEAYCRKTITQSAALSVQNAPATGWDDDPAYERFGLGSYIGVKVEVEDGLYGTLCFASSEVRDRPFSENEQRVIELLAQWVCYELDRQRSHEALRRQNERLEEFASVVSHDLRNPLNVARGYVEMLDEELEDERVRSLQNALDRMHAIIEDVLTLAREGETADDQSPVALDAVARHAWENVESTDAALRTEDDVVILADFARLTRLLENAFRNAIEHAGPDVTVTVAATPEGFTVTDDGPGFPEEILDRVFEPSLTTEPDGTGFGLAIVRTIAEAHDWTVSATNPPDSGARLVFEGVKFERSQQG